MSQNFRWRREEQDISLFFSFNVKYKDWGIEYRNMVYYMESFSEEACIKQRKDLLTNAFSQSH